MLMTGAVSVAVSAVRVTAQLVDRETEEVLWNEPYSSDLADVHTMQTEIASRIAADLGAEILPQELASIVKALTDSEDAYLLYLRAKSSVAEPSPVTDPDLAVQIHERLDEAIELDPEFAAAHALKAMHYASSTQGVLRIDDALSRADRTRLTREHAQRALDIDPMTPLAYVAIARLAEGYLRADEARQNYERAFRLAPNDPDLLIDYAGFGVRDGRPDEALDMAITLAEVSPGYGHWILGTFHCWIHRCAEGIAPLRESVRLQPESGTARVMLALAEGVRGNADEALAEARIAERRFGDGFVAPTFLVVLAHIYASLDRPDDARRIFDRIESMSGTYTVGDTLWASAYLAIGNEGQALARLERAAESTEPDDGYLNRFFLRLNLYHDPRLEQPEFRDVRSRLGF